MPGSHHFSRHQYFPQPRASPPARVRPCHLESFARVSLRYTSWCFCSVLAAKYAEAFGLRILVQRVPMFSFGMASVAIDVVKR